MQFNFSNKGKIVKGAIRFAFRSIKNKDDNTCLFNQDIVRIICLYIYKKNMHGYLFPIIRQLLVLVITAVPPFFLAVSTGSTHFTSCYCFLCWESKNEKYCWIGKYYYYSNSHKELDLCKAIKQNTLRWFIMHHMEKDVMLLIWENRCVYVF